MAASTANGEELAGAGRRPQLHNLTSLRAFAALAIFLHHLNILGIDVSQSAWNMNLGGAVSFFFVLSGFVLSYSFEGQFLTWRDTRNFIFQRFFRLWPVHIICFFIAVVILQAPVNLFTAYLTTTLQSSWFPTYGTAYTHNGVSWSISVELFFYLTLPFILTLRPRSAMLLACGWTLAVFSLFAIAAVLPSPIFPPQSPQPWRDFYVTDASFVQLFPPFRMIEFLAGIVLYQFFKDHRIPDRWVAFCQIAAIVCLLFCARTYDDVAQFFAEHTSDMTSVAHREFGMYPMFAIIVYVFAHQSGFVTRLVSFRPLVLCGEISFSFYMIHQIVIRNLHYNFDIDGQYGSIAAALSAGVISLIFAIIFHQTVEMPAIRWAKRHFPMSKHAPLVREIAAIAPA
ncbi:acyltransferase [Mesorhizobium sp. INR15]|uniref:acyltransferase family protein n=1 Tax=Mesorhizobium sp. INR15 TaxID=2654248 RepID=UPI0018966044|nr:acyltransferase [Mesorhizobium sp. INR15]